MFGCDNGNNCIWIILLLALCNGNSCGNFGGCGGKGCNDGCSSLIWILLLCSLCGNDCGCGKGSGCGC